MLLRILLRITNLPSESSFRLLPGLTQSSVGQHRGYRRHIGPLISCLPIYQIQTKSAEIYLKNGDFQVKKVEKVEFEGKGIEEYQ